MFKIAAIFEGKRPVCDFREAFEEAGREISDIFMDVYDTAEIDRDEDICRESLESVKQADFVIFNFHGSMAYFRSYLKFREYFEGKKPYFFRSTIESEMEEMTKQCKLPAQVVTTLLSYLEAGGKENLRNFLRYLFQKVAGYPCTYEPVVFPRWDGYYGKDEGLTDEAYLEAVSQDPKPVIGVLIHFHTIQTGETEYLDQLMAIIRDFGCTPLVLYSNVMPSTDVSYGGLRASLRKYLIWEGRSVPQAMIVAAGHSLSVLSAPGCGMEQVQDSIFEILGVPAIQALTTNYTYQQWQESVRGMDAMYLGNVYTAEFDGQLIGVPLTCTEQVKTPYGVKERPVLVRDRAEKLVRLAKNWANLSRIPQSEKKVAIILHNMPPRADMIGCAYGLDTPESVYHLVCAMEGQGIRTEYAFRDGQEIIDRITKGLTNDGRFRSAEELLARAEATAGPQEWQSWFTALPEKIRRELLRDWGEAPGDFMAVGDQILVPCIKNGNILIGLQPPRAQEEKAEECYHSTDLVCPYQYLAFYRYLEYEFGANAVIHVGTHGTIEWLPGKEIGLSRNCYPDAAIGNLPNIYPYIIDVPGEGAQAKRRTAACIVDHLIPSMREGGAYGDIAVIDERLAKYYHAKQNGNSKTAELQEEIRELAERMNLTRDLGLTWQDFTESFEETAEKLHLWVSEIKASEIRDGLHVFGQPPKGERLTNLLRLLVRVKNGNVPSLRQGICRMLGYDLESLLEYPEACDETGRTNAMKLEQADEIGRKLFACWEEKGYAKTEIAGMIQEISEQEGLNPARSDQLEQCLRFVADEVYPRLMDTADEIQSVLDGLNGKFVRKGPSGAPSRGNAHILPTGRNFYTIDPTEVPSRAAWETGKRLADQLLKTHEKETGAVPEEIAIVVYSGETMKTGGDDIAEILYLYGVRPVWLGQTDRVIGLEVIPTEELGRPRIDVTLRISGLFRDTFPNLIELVDEAVNLAAGLEEGPEENFIRKHVEADMETFLKSGLDREQAYERAAVRIFGCPPGNYGAGVDIMVNSRKWETSDDLGKAYITWSGHGYSRRYHGEKMQDLFANRLTGCDVTVKNISSCEADMLDSDDFYNYHGGLIAAVKSQKGSAPASYSTNAADTEHVVTRNVAQETARIMRARINNPRWIEGMKQHGFKGAQEFSVMVDILFGWDATSDVVEDYMYDDVFEQYLNNQELHDWIKEVNPWALHAMSERLLEAAQRNMWNASEEKLEKLQEIYLEMEGDFEGDEE
ncbi:MAG: cobaltochelatase subunit CobN [Eubacteriales bacterium]|nr:cobaltochelatase subunit CobN [Eubacteriales bacterium]